MSREVVKIFIAPEAGAPMHEVKSVRAIAGVGLEGDRYARGVGSWSGQRAAVRHATIISLPAVRQANSRLTVPFELAETRRNIVVDGLNATDLHRLIGVEFRIDAARVRGVEACDPCQRPDMLSGKKGFHRAFPGTVAGLRIEILESGVIAVGGSIIVTEF